jgi:hypothetical protein
MDFQSFQVPQKRRTEESGYLLRPKNVAAKTGNLAETFQVAPNVSNAGRMIPYGTIAGQIANRCRFHCASVAVDGHGAQSLPNI